jgi:hypothetical protein
MSRIAEETVYRCEVGYGVFIAGNLAETPGRLNCWGAIRHRRSRFRAAVWLILRKELPWY